MSCPFRHHLVLSLSRWGWKWFYHSDESEKGKVNYATIQKVYIENELRIVPDQTAWLVHRINLGDMSKATIGLADILSAILPSLSLDQMLPPPPTQFDSHHHQHQHHRHHPTTITIIIITRPKPAYGRQGLAGSGAKIQIKRECFGVFLTSHFAPPALSSDIN